MKFVKGTYTLAASNLKIPEGYIAILEDLLTGQTHDLSAGKGYTFKVNRTIPERLLIHITFSPNKISASK